MVRIFFSAKRGGGREQSLLSPQPEKYFFPSQFLYPNTCIIHVNFPSLKKSLARLSSASLANFFERKVSEEAQYVVELNRNAFGSKEWTAAHARLAEMQTLQLISSLTFGQVNEWKDQLVDPEAAEYTIRDASCPNEYVQKLTEIHNFT